MTDTRPTPTADTAATALTRFNALRHGLLSRYTVLPWEDADEYHVLLAALAAEHQPQGPTEEHLVEELAGDPVTQAAAAPGRGRRAPTSLGAWSTPSAPGGETQEDMRDMEEDDGHPRRRARYQPRSYTTHRAYGPSWRLRR